MTKPMPTLGVLGVYTGITLTSFSDIHDVFDHLYPGIMTREISAMADTAKREILRQHPEFAELPDCESYGWENYADMAIKRFGPTIEVDGPHGTGNPGMEGQ